MKHASISALLVTTKLSVTAIIAIVVLAACTCSGATALRDTVWELESLNGNTPLPGTTITLEFSDDQISGSAGCNHYFGTYAVNGSNITISDVGSTEMYCLDPEGVMDQEQAFLATLASTASYRLTGARLDLLDATGSVILAFEPLSALTTPTAELTEIPPTSVPSTPTAEPTEVAPPTFEPPAGFKQYQDSVTGVSIYIPESWVVIGVVPGQSAILQSYPEDKYVGGEPFDPGDTKCDLTIRPPDTDMASHMQQLKSDPTVTIVSEQEIVLQSGKPGLRVEVESMGRSLSLITEVNERVVVLACFGELAPFDEIAVTVGASE